MVSIKSLLSFAVYLNDVSLYNYAMNAFVNDPCASLFAMYNSKTGQSVESGRDQCMNPFSSQYSDLECPLTHNAIQLILSPGSPGPHMQLE